jgi:hypothetical protein
MPESGDSAADRQSVAQPTGGSHPFRHVILGAWADLFRSRDGLLLKCYCRLPAITPPGTAPPATLEEARARCDSSPERPGSEMDRDLVEARMVRVTRILAAWLAFWSTIVPLVVVAGFIVWRLGRIQAQGQDWTDQAVIVIASVILFPLLSILCLLLQAPLMVGLVNRLIRQPEMQRDMDR